MWRGENRLHPSSGLSRGELSAPLAIQSTRFEPGITGGTQPPNHFLPDTTMIDSFQGTTFILGFQLTRCAMPAQSTRAHDEASRNNPFPPSLFAVMCGLVVAAFLFVVHRVSTLYGLGFDYLFGGVIVGLLVYRYELHRLRYVTDRLKSVKLMNHHVRNALNLIMVSVYVHGNVQELHEIQSSCNRIDWALREILPGRELDDYDEAAAEKKRAETA